MNKDIAHYRARCEELEAEVARLERTVSEYEGSDLASTRRAMMEARIERDDAITRAEQAEARADEIEGQLIAEHELRVSISRRLEQAEAERDKWKREALISQRGEAREVERREELEARADSAEPQLPRCPKHRTLLIISDA